MQKLFLLLLACGAALAAADERTVSSPIVIGFVGGFVAHDDTIHSEVQLANRLGADNPYLRVKIFENRRGDRAYREVLRLLDTDHDGELSAEEKHNARIAIYGHSWGASEGIALARALGRDRIPVMLTIQVDSVQKLGQDDEWIPANVKQAINYYQLDGILHGCSRIRAVDGARTKILGNFQCEYRRHPVRCPGYPWYARMLMRPHIEIESDPAVWTKVESLIRSTLAPVPAR